MRSDDSLQRLANQVHSLLHVHVKTVFPSPFPHHLVEPQGYSSKEKSIVLESLKNLFGVVFRGNRFQSSYIVGTKALQNGLFDRERGAWFFCCLTNSPPVISAAQMRRVSRKATLSCIAPKLRSQQSMDYHFLTASAIGSGMLKNTKYLASWCTINKIYAKRL